MSVDEKSCWRTCDETCPDFYKDWCPCVKSEFRANAQRSKERKRKVWVNIMKDPEVAPLFKEIREFNQDSYHLVLLNGKEFSYYPTTGTLVNRKSKYKTNLDVQFFRKYFSFLRK